MLRNKFDKSIVDSFLEKTVVLDTETTNLYAEKAEICELATAVYNSGTSRWMHSSSLFGTIHPIPPEASAKNNISQSMLAGRPTFGQKWNVATEMLEQGSKSYYIAHNSEYDRRVFENVVERDNLNLGPKLGKMLEKNSWICTWRLAKAIYGVDFNDMQYGLNYLRYRLNLPVDDDIVAHRASNDVVMTCALLERLITEAWQNELVDPSSDLELGTQLHALCWKPHEWKTWPYGKHRGAEIKKLPNDYIIWAIDNMDVLNQDSSNYNFDLAYSLKAEIENRLR